MKKWLKITLGVVGGIIILFVIDLICVFTINRPLFAIKEENGDSVNLIYRGLFYDTYNCHEFSAPQIKVKGAKFTCAVIEFDEGKDNNEEHHFEAAVLECNQNNMIVKPEEKEDEYQSSDKFTIKYTDGFVCKIGDKVLITYKGFINESYPAQVGTTNIEIVK